MNKKLLALTLAGVLTCTLPAVAVAEETAWYEKEVSVGKVNFNISLCAAAGISATAATSALIYLVTTIKDREARVQLFKDAIFLSNPNHRWTNAQLAAALVVVAGYGISIISTIAQGGILLNRYRTGTLANQEKKPEQKPIEKKAEEKKADGSNPPVVGGNGDKPDAPENHKIVAPENNDYHTNAALQKWANAYAKPFVALWTSTEKDELMAAIKQLPTAQKNALLDAVKPALAKDKFAYLHSDGDKSKLKPLTTEALTQRDICFAVRNLLLPKKDDTSDEQPNEKPIRDRS